MVSKKLQNKFYAALESLKDGKNDYILEALAAGAKATFEGVKYGYEWKFHTPGEEPLVSKFGSPDYSDNYDPNDRLSYAKNLAEKAKRFDEPNPRFGKPMTKTYKDGSYTSITPMRREWDDEYQRFGIPKAIRRRVDQLIAENGWDIVLDKSGYSYDKQNKRHNEIPEKYVWTSETTDPAMIEEITRTLAPLGFKHDTETHEAHYGFTGHGPIDTETFSLDVWKYTDKPVSPIVAEAVTKLGNAIMAMRTKENAALVEAIKSGCDACFTFNYDGNGWTPDEENPQPSAPTEPVPQGKYQFVGANEDEGDGDTADGVYAHGELEDRLGYDILCFCGTTLEQFQQDLVNGYHNDPNFGNGIPVTVKGINEPCSLYVWYTQFGNGFVLPRGVVVLNSDTDAVNYAKEMWTKKPQRF